MCKNLNKCRILSNIGKRIDLKSLQNITKSLKIVKTSTIIKKYEFFFLIMKTLNSVLNEESSSKNPDEGY
jgi:hypothetical protein